MAAAVAHIPISTTLDTDHSAPGVDTSERESIVKPRDIHTELNYYKEPEDGSAPHATYIDRPETYVRPTETHPAIIHDVRGSEAKYTLDRSGFEFIRHPSTEKDFLDDEQIKAGYYPEVEQLLKDFTGASKVFIFDHTIRRSSPSDPDQGTNLRRPVQQVHIDQSFEAAISRVSHHLPEEAEELVKGRVQIINVWRPIKTVLRDPLTVARADTVSDSDLVKIPLIYPTRRGETYSVRHDPSHKWFYKSELTPEEALLIKCFDTKADGRARRAPHTAFVDPETGDDVPARESIEVRALVFHPEDRE